MGGTWRTGVAALAASLAAVAPAWGSGGAAQERRLLEDGRVVLLHSDSQDLGLGEERMERSWGAQPQLRGPAGRAADGSVTPATTWCGDLRGTDDVEHGRTTLPRYKVVYAYPADGDPGRLLEPVTFPAAGTSPSVTLSRATVMQRAATWVAGKVLDGSGGSRGVRFDYGTRCGPQYLDILALRLPRTAAEYNQVGDPARNDDERARLLRADLLAARQDLGLDRGVWDFLVFADTGPAPSSWTWAEAYLEPDTTPDAARNANAGDDQVAILWPGAFSGSAGIGYTAYIATHEVLHTLGAVLPGAPHATPRRHCTDGYSILCYDDDGPGGDVELDVVCPGGSEVPTSSLEFDEVALDCGSDDYFSTAPALGSFLARSWNTHDHPAVCPAALCLASTIEPLAAAGAPGSGTAGAPVRFDASGSSDRDGDLVRFDWDLDGDGAAEHSTADPALEVVPRRSGAVGGGRVVVTDDTGLTAQAPLPRVPIAGRPPVVALGAPGAVPSGTPVALDASASYDPDDGGRIESYRFTLPGGEVVAGASPVATFTPARPGRYEAHVTATDDEGRSAGATVAVDVLNRGPTVTASRSRASLRLGSAVTLTAAAADPDGQVVSVSWDLDGDGVADDRGERVSVVFPETGRRRATVTVTDDLGAAASATVVVDVLRPRRSAGSSPRSVLPSLRRSRRGTITARVRCRKKRTCRYRVAAGTVRRNVTVRRGATRKVTLRLPSRLRRRTVRFTLRDRATGRRLARRTLPAPRR